MEELGTAVTSAKALHKGDQRGHTPQLQGCLHQGSPIAPLLCMGSSCPPALSAAHPPAALHGCGTVPPIAIQ